MKHLSAILLSALAITAHASDNTAMTGGASDAYSQCLVKEFDKQKDKADTNDLANSVIVACKKSLAAHVEHLYNAETSDPNQNPGSESKDEFQERVTAEEVKEAKVLIGSWIAQSK
ncbi:hypothetical protein [Pseudomonas sp.]|uniref:hypothetical protein n=1 Tax=Pseudomonas sp. TaxID=306 RepID=UPI0029AB14A4|nr:hypothetical protein [Pseudomonas sp.]MDX3740347.1 hypothetical protein [Pseudomonas sp.]